jgi:endonuclease YncB( thermonuclease family)
MIPQKKYFYIIVSLLVFLPSVLLYSQNSDTSYFVSFDEITKIIDGDTFKFKNIEKSNRLLCLDTEETFKGKNAYEKTAEIADSWLDFYYQSKIEKGTEHPIKLDSPFGYETALWTTEFFKDVKRVRIEIDDTLRTVDIYGRELVYVFAEKDGKFINYNLECVRQGYSPYFNKYGNSNRFHKEFTEAQEYARKNKLGIWNPAAKCYPDYDERIKWWNKRALQIENYKKKYADNNKFVNLLNDDAKIKLSGCIGQKVTVFGSVSEVFSFRFPYLLRITLSKGESLDLFINEDDAGIFNEIDLEKLESNFFYCSGILEKNSNNYKIILRKLNQISIQ